jgi:preprotein translocase subunit SecA
MLISIREDVTRTLGTSTFSMSPAEMPDMSQFGALPELPEFHQLPEFRGLPDFITNHIDPFTGDDDTADIDAGTGNILSRLPPLQIERPAMPEDVNVAELPRVSRNAPCPCGSGLKYKHCHGGLA